MWSAIRAHLDDPTPERPARPSKGDVWVALVAAAVALAEGAFRSGVALRPLAIAAALVVAATLVFRRSHPLPAVLVGFLVGDVLLAIEVGFKVERLGLDAGAFVLLQPFALLRYGTAGEVGLGVLAVLFTYAFAMLSHPIASEAIGAAVVLCLPIAAGAALRFRDGAHRRDVEHAQLRERQAIARELHDTVAHHVAAIAIQAQAAQAVRARRPEAVGDALAAIEAESSRALAELRALVGALREDDAASLAPTTGVDDIAGLVADAGPLATFARSGDLDGLSPAAAAALHRIAKESIHNALRHGGASSKIAVRLEGASSSVRLTVENDGPVARAPSGRGFGIVGMKERAALLGGTLEAVPLPAGGFRVEAVLPRAHR